MQLTPFYLFYTVSLFIFPTIIGFRKANRTDILHPKKNIIKLVIFLLFFGFCVEYILEINNSDPQKIISANYFVPLSIVFTASLTKVAKHAKISINYYQGVNHVKIFIIVLLILTEITLIHWGYQQFRLLPT